MLCPPVLSVECNPLVGCWAAHNIYYNIYGDTSLSTSLSLLTPPPQSAKEILAFQLRLVEAIVLFMLLGTVLVARRRYLLGGGGGCQGLHLVSLENAAKSVVSPQSLSRPPLLEHPQSPVPLVLPWPWRVYVG